MELNSDLGSLVLSDAEQRMVYDLALRLRSRDTAIIPQYTPEQLPKGVRPLTPKDYMFLYVKAAGIIIQTARALMAIQTHPLMPKKSIEDWIRIITEVRVSESFEKGFAETHTPLLAEMRTIEGEVNGPEPE